MLLLPDYRLLHGERVVGLDLLVLSSAKCLEAGETVAIKKVFTDKRYKNRGAAADALNGSPKCGLSKHLFLFHDMPKNELFLDLVMEYAPEKQISGSRHYSNIFRGLAYIRTVHGVSHKDVKPQNLLVSDLRSCLGFSQTDQLDAKHVGRDGLAAGKGVVVAMTLEEAYEAVDSMLVEGIFGSAGCSVVIEEFLEGEEALFFALVDGKNAIPLESAQDHKCVGDGDTGPNTGGIGKECLAEGRKFVGVLYAGLMIEKNRAPKLIESTMFLKSTNVRVDATIHARLLAYAKVTHHEVVLGIVLPDVFSSPSSHQT
ncbi:hypothetical protein IFM89_011597 [Coptis chinensis]|uniref:Phosphoribosylglycinamide synthetase ATP-grasp (A) domain-containing protein n=1 Tax=Coptis chinensis TaxID=261450 RepID=A0A835LHK3_9MAGN|nr:hypothetical protein IFM89_011597 [Coptis chinensis]